MSKENSEIRSGGMITPLRQIYCIVTAIKSRSLWLRGV